MKFPTLKTVLKESKVFDVFADDLLDINLAAAKSGETEETKQVIKRIFKDLHSSSPDLNKIHGEIEELKRKFNIASSEAVEKEHTKVVSTNKQAMSSDEEDFMFKLLDFNIKMNSADISQVEKDKIRNALRDLRAKIGKEPIDKLKSELDQLTASI